MKSIGLCFLLLAMVCSAAEPERALTEFRENNFGCRFSHSKSITIAYNPHGRANFIPISWNGKPFGALHIRDLPPASTDEEFISKGKAYFQKEFNASSIEHRFHENPKQFKFHVFTIRMTHKETHFIIERFVHFRRKNKEATLAREILAEKFGSFEFEFLASDTDYPSLKPEIDILINTFKLE
ncbi:MAG: hypothetical protein V4710_02995 [Verrucomicrobiota bacterium]